MTEPVAALTDFSLSLVRNGIRNQVLERIDLQIRPGEILGLVGESGSGKSVLALSLLGLLPHTSHPQADGQVTVSGVDMVRAGPAELRRVRGEVLGAIFQDPMTSLNPTMRIGKQIGEVTHDDAESVRLLETVGVRDAQLRLRVYPHELSGGLRQRVMAAIAVGGRPGLIVADEPTTALDVTVQAQLLDLLRELRDEFGCSVLLITHDLGVVADLADRVVVMYAGRTIEEAGTEALFARHSHPYTRGLLEAVPDPERRAGGIREIPGRVPTLRSSPDECTFADRCQRADSLCRARRPELLPGPAGHPVRCVHPLPLPEVSR